ncbi:MAG: hypothetical protein ACI7YS_06240 [Flavobacterium sp.]
MKNLMMTLIAAFMMVSFNTSAQDKEVAEHTKKEKKACCSKEEKSKCKDDKMIKAEKKECKKKCEKDKK